MKIFLLAVIMTLAATSWDVQEYCCPGACAVAKKQDSARGDRVLRACMSGLGSTSVEISNASVFQNCRCP